MSLTPNFPFVDGKIPEPSRFAGFMKLVSEELNIPFIDHYNYIALNWDILGEKYIKEHNWFPSDYKHTSPEAADFNAKMIISGIKCQKIEDLVAVLSDKAGAVNYPCLVTE